VVWFVCSTVDTDLLSAVLAKFAQAVGAGQDKLVVLVLDQAGWHVSDRLVVPDGIVLEFLPSYTPELVDQRRWSTAERLWPLTNQAVANRRFATLEALATALSARCCTLAAMPEIIMAETRFGWWPVTAVANGSSGSGMIRPRPRAARRPRRGRRRSRR
jgi:hypothetical protein